MMPLYQKRTRINSAFNEVSNSFDVEFQPLSWSKLSNNSGHFIGCDGREKSIDFSERRPYGNRALASCCWHMDGKLLSNQKPASFRCYRNPCNVFSRELGEKSCCHKSWEIIILDPVDWGIWRPQWQFEIRVDRGVVGMWGSSSSGNPMKNVVGEMPQTVASSGRSKMNFWCPKRSE